MTNETPLSDKLLTSSETAKLLGLKNPQTLAVWRCVKRFPELECDGIWTFGYDTESHLTLATKTGVSASYLYDPHHRQVQKTVGSVKTRFLYQGLQRIADYDGTSGTLQNRYVYGTRLDEPLIQVSATGVTTYLHQDRIGNIIAISNSSGSVINRLKYHVSDIKCFASSAVSLVANNQPTAYLL